jgi:RNA polymerase sigma-70 factor, ECF subfamily
MTRRRVSVALFGTSRRLTANGWRRMILNRGLSTKRMEQKLSPAGSLAIVRSDPQRPETINEGDGDLVLRRVDLDEGGLGRVEMLDQVSMAFIVVLQRLTPAERAVLLLRDVFDFDYDEIAALVGKSKPACRKLLERARQNVATEKRFFSSSPEEHRRLLAAFTQAATSGDIDMLVAMLAEDAVLITDGGPEGRRVGGIRNLQAPLHGAARIAAFVAATARSSDLDTEIHELNGQPALVFYDEDAPFAALLLAVADDRIHRVFFHADTARLRYLGPRTGASLSLPVS